MRNANDEVIKTITELIKEVKQEMQQKKVLLENKQPEQIFEHHLKEIDRYIKTNVLQALKESSKDK